MAQITVRQIDDEEHAALKRRAARNHRSVEGEVRALIGDATREDRRAEFVAWSRGVRDRLRPGYDGDAVADIREDRDSR